MEDGIIAVVILWIMFLLRVFTYGMDNLAIGTLIIAVILTYLVVLVKKDL